MGRKKINSELKTLLMKYPIVLADIGAAGGIHERWKDLGAGIRVLGFEPDQRAFESLINDDKTVWVNAALADHKGEATLLVTRYQTNTSLLQPNRKLIDPIYQNPADFDVVKEVAVPCTTLDQASINAGIYPSAIKIDTQGTELSILRGALQCLERSLLVIEVEVEFIALYKDQPLFGEIDEFLTDKGFILFDLGNLLMLKRGQYGFHGERKGQLIAADALYFRSPESLVELAKKLNTEKSEELIYQYCGVCVVYGYRNLALEALNLFKKHNLLDINLFNYLCAAIDHDGAYSLPRFWIGQGRISKWLRKLVERIEPRHNSIWINDIGNE